MIEVVGHRGAAKLVPENTLPSFEKAIALGCNATECDVRLTADGHLVICHDDSVDRTTNGTGKVSDLSLDQLRALDAGDGAVMPTLQELLRTVAGRILLLCELKGEGTPAPTVAAVRAAGMEAQVVFTSFVIDRIAEVRALGNELRIAGIFSEPDYDILPRLVELRAEAADVHFRNLTPEFVKAAHAHGLTCRGWNPDTVEDIKHTVALGVDSVSSNRPDLAIEVVRG
jgi:glycerophosphoryl diester phosphodiesterase